ncbi:MAG TPA: ABC transporter substrate-binding protein [Chloroflexota bacterium]|jgi:NitT/TauT family transport system substrate-binding protein
MARGGWLVAAALLLVAAIACAAPAAPRAQAPASEASAPAGLAAGVAGQAPPQGAGPAAGIAGQAPGQGVAAAEPAAPQTPTAVVIGFFPSTTSVVWHIAEERGYLAEQGIAAELTPFRTLPDAVAMLNAGKIDVYGGGAGANLFNAVARGIQLRAVADYARSEAGTKSKAIVARRDLWESGEVRALGDLRGRTVSTTVSTGGQEYQVYKLLQTVGLTLDDVELKGMPPPDQVAALGNRATDAAYLFQPALCTAERRNLGVVLQPTFDDVASGSHGGLTYYGETFIREKPRAASALMVAYLKGVRDYVDAQRYGVNRAQVIELMRQYVPTSDASYYDECEWGRINPDGYIDRGWLEDEMAWAVANGLVERPVSVDQFVTNTFVDDAIRVLGPYRPPQ